MAESEMTSIISEFENMSEEEKMALSILLEIQQQSQSTRRHQDHTHDRHHQNHSPSPSTPRCTPRKTKEVMSFKLYCQTVKPLKDKTKTLNSTLRNKAQLINPNSQKIIKQKQKKGSKYVPIHLRTSDQLRKKFDHISQLRSKMKCKQQRTYKECTFTPSIIKTHKTSKRDPADFVDQLYKKNTNYRQVSGQVINENVELEEYLNKSAELNLSKSFEKEIGLRLGSLQKVEKRERNNKSPIRLSNKWPNKKFNILLDIIK